jgi:hypothetical protein
MGTKCRPRNGSGHEGASAWPGGARQDARRATYVGNNRLDQGNAAYALARKRPQRGFRSRHLSMAGAAPAAQTKSHTAIDPEAARLRYTRPWPSRPLMVADRSVIATTSPPPIKGTSPIAS